MLLVMFDPKPLTYISELFCPTSGLGQRQLLYCFQISPGTFSVASTYSCIRRAQMDDLAARWELDSWDGVVSVPCQFSSSAAAPGPGLLFASQTVAALYIDPF